MGTISTVANVHCTRVSEIMRACTTARETHARTSKVTCTSRTHDTERLDVDGRPRRRFEQRTHIASPPRRVTA